jgi:hypothetical protein
MRPLAVQNMPDSSNSYTEVLPSRSARRGPVIVIVALLVLCAVGGNLIFRANQRRVVSEQIGQFRALAHALETIATEQEGALPAQMPAIIGPASLDTRDAWVVYRPVTASGETIRFDPAGNRIVAWSPEPSVRGRRTIVLNDLTVQLVTEDMIDLNTQRFLAGEALSRSHAVFKSAPGAQPSPARDDIPTSQD